MENRANYTLLHIDRPEELAAYARARGWLLPAESVCALGRAGEGNMNLTLRVQTAERSFILKQARPWVERYPAIAAPEERVLVEAAFYRAVAGCPLVAERMPGFLGWDEENFVAAFEDLGETADCTDLYDDGGAAFAPLPGLCQWLAALHQAAFDDPTRTRLENRAMRQLNHEHLYCFPLRPDNGLDLDAITLGLTRGRPSLARRRGVLQRYCRTGRALLGKRPLPVARRLLSGKLGARRWGRVDHRPGVLFLWPAGIRRGHSRRPPVARRSSLGTSAVGVCPLRHRPLAFPAAWRCNLPGWRSCGGSSAWPSCRWLLTCRARSRCWRPRGSWCWGVREVRQFLSPIMR